MNQRATANVGEMMEAQHDIHTLKLMLANANVEVNKWKITFDADVEYANGGYGITLKANANGHHVSQFIGQELAVYFSDDLDTIVHQYASMMITSLMIDVAKEELSKVLTPAIQNVAKLAASKGFAK